MRRFRGGVREVVKNVTISLTQELRMTTTESWLTLKKQSNNRLLYMHHRKQVTDTKFNVDIRIASACEHPAGT